MMFENLIPSFVLYQNPDSPYSEVIRELLGFTDLPFTEISVNGKSHGSPKILPTLSVDGNLVSGVGPVCRRITAFVGLHGSNPREDCIVSSVASQILDLWEETIVFQLTTKNDEEKITFILELLTNFVKGAHNGIYVVGQRLTWADILLIHFVRFLIRTVLKSDARIKNKYPRLAHFILVQRREHCFFDLY